MNVRAERQSGRYRQRGARRAGRRSGFWGRVVKPKRALWAFGAALLLINAAFQPFVHWKPFWAGAEAEAWKRDVSGILRKDHLNAEDYEALFRQTGLGRLAVDSLRRSGDGGWEKLAQFQERFLESLGNSGSAERQCSGSFFTKQDKLASGSGEVALLAPLEDGDIFLSFSSHTLGWKHGHAGLVVDAEAGLCLEALMPGCSSDIRSVGRWKSCADFIILRLRGSSEQERRKIAGFAGQNLKGVPYSLFSGLAGREKQEPIGEMKAQCAYLIWYAFMRFGYDLDGDGGRLVTVGDLLKAPCLEVVQVYGIGPDAVRRKMGKPQAVQPASGKLFSVSPRRS